METICYRCGGILYTGRIEHDNIDDCIKYTGRKINEFIKLSEELIEKKKQIKSKINEINNGI